MRLLLLSLTLFATGCASLGQAERDPNAPAMRYSHAGFSVDDEAARVHQSFEMKLDQARSIISETLPEGAPVTLVYVTNTLNLVDTPTSFTRDMGGPEAPTARIAAAQQYRGSALRVIDPDHFSANTTRWSRIATTSPSPSCASSRTRSSSRSSRSSSERASGS